MFLSEFDLGAIYDSQTKQEVGGAELKSQIRRRQNELARAGLQSQDIVLLFSQNTTSLFVDLLALWELQICVALIEPGSRWEQVKRWGDHLGAKGMIGLERKIEILAPQSAQSRLPENSALILFTSGTTGLPKGVVHDFSSIRRKMKILEQFIPTQEVKRTLCALPTSFGHGLICNSLFPLFSGSHLFIENGFTLPLVSKLTEYCLNHQITFFSSTPTVWNMIEGLASKDSQLKLQRVHCASAPLDHRRIGYMRKWCPQARFFNVYGLTEFLGWVSGHEIQEADSGDNVGAPWGVEVIVTEDSPGRIFLNADFKFKGYFESSEEIGSFQSVLGNHFDTGDLGEKTEKGELRLLGRSKLVINKAGLKIGPEEIESTLATMDELLEVCCFPVADDFSGQRVGLAVVVKDHAEEFEASKMKAKISKWLAERLPRYKVPDHIWIVESLPRNSRGKLDRQVLMKSLGVSKP